MTSVNINESKRNVTVGVTSSDNGDSQKYTTYMKLDSSDVIDITNDSVNVNGTVTATDVQVNDTSLNQQSNALSTLTSNVSTLERTVESLQKEVDDLKNLSPISVTVDFKETSLRLTLNYDKQSNELYFSNHPSYKVDGVQYGVVSPFIVFSEDGGGEVRHAIADMIVFNPQSGEVRPIEYYIATAGHELDHDWYRNPKGEHVTHTWDASFDTQTSIITINTDGSSHDEDPNRISFAESVNIFQRPKSTS